jgi:hypothetical protein
MSVMDANMNAARSAAKDMKDYASGERMMASAKPNEGEKFFHDLGEILRKAEFRY